MDTAKKVWTYLLRAGLTPEGAAGLMGNIFAESGMIPERVEILCLKRLKEQGKIYTDATYTAFVDDGTITKEQFLHPLPGRQYGYGLCQWTSPNRKSRLYDLAKRKQTSIGDTETQLEWLLSELTISYKEVLRILKSTKNVLTASNAVLTRFEMPADAGASVRETRYRYSMKYYNQFMEEKMAKTRTAIVDLAKSWIGRKESNGSHRMIIDIYNAHRPLARGYKVTYTDAWCATFISTLAIKLGYTDIIPLECGCPEMVEKAKKMGIWVESDAYTPKPGDIIMYDWQDSGSGDNRGTPDHVGIVASVSGTTFVVIEGNKNDAVGTRMMAMNGKNIRGYICPKYDPEAENKLVAACRKMDAEMIKSQQAGAKWGYYNSNTAVTFDKALSAKTYRANCATTAVWALKMIGAIDDSLLGFYGEVKGAIAWKSTKTKDAVLAVADVIYINGKKTVAEALKDGTLIASDIVTYYNLRHTNIYLGNGEWLDSGHAYADGSGDGAGWKTWIGGTYYGAQPIGAIIRLKAASEEKKTDAEVNPICGTCSVTLKQFLIGAEDPQVKIIQLKLNYLGYRGKNGQILAVDGQLGPNTAYAIEQFQRKAGLPDSTNWGTVGAKTWALILG